MEKLLDIKRKFLYDGIGIDTEKILFTIIAENTKIQFYLPDFDRNPLRKLSDIIGQYEFDHLIKSENVNAANGHYHTNYLSPERLNFYYFLHDEYIVLLSAGEFQPAREMVVLESVWKNK